MLVGNVGKETKVSKKGNLRFLFAPRVLGAPYSAAQGVLKGWIQGIQQGNRRGGVGQGNGGAVYRAFGGDH